MERGIGNMGSGVGRGWKRERKLAAGREGGRRHLWDIPETLDGEGSRKSLG